MMRSGASSAASFPPNWNGIDNQMTPNRQSDSNNIRPRLYLVTPVIDDAESLVQPLREALDAAEIAALLLRLSPADERSQINRVKTLAPLVQEKGAALLLDGLPHIVARSGADGAHLTGFENFLAAAASLKPERIAGIGGLETRHDAMSAAEKGADYVMFGEPDQTGARPALDAICERVAWWAEVFEAPCVGYAAQADEIAPLVRAHADFIALGDFVFADSRGIKTAIIEAARNLAVELAA